MNSTSRTFRRSLFEDAKLAKHLYEIERRKQKMKKAIIMLALIIFLSGVIVATLIVEHRTKEGIVDEWNPITPRELYPQNITGWAVNVNITGGTCLELNISASDDVKVIVGILVDYNEITKETKYGKVLFNKTDTYFTNSIPIAEIGDDPHLYLEIRNEGDESVILIGSVKKLGNITKKRYPYSGIGSLTALFGLVLLTYGIITKPNKKCYAKKRRISKSK